MPIVDSILRQNPIKPSGASGFTFAAHFALDQARRRLDGLDGHDSSQQQDFLDLVLQIRSDEGEDVSMQQMIVWLITNLVAGADTTAFTINAGIYYLARNQQVQEELRKDLKRVVRDRETPSWKACNDSAYLGAVVQETLRLYPAVGLPLERVVPKGGLTLPEGNFIPQGTIVGVNPCVVNRSKHVYGPDADDFRPERWLCCQDEHASVYELRLAQMHNANFTFGFGKRACSGSNLAIVQLHKVLAALCLNFQVSDPLVHQVQTAPQCLFTCLHSC